MAALKVRHEATAGVGEAESHAEAQDRLAADYDAIDAAMLAIAEKSAMTNAIGNRCSSFRSLSQYVGGSGSLVSFACNLEVGCSLCVRCSANCIQFAFAHPFLDRMTLTAAAKGSDRQGIANSCFPS